MKRRVLLVLIMAVAAVVAACQPTPEEGIIKNKKNDTFVDQLESQNKNTEINDNEPNISEPIDKFEGYEKQWYEDIKAKGKNINVKFEANIVVPNADKIPVYEVILNKISQEQVDSFLSAFGDTKYSLGFELCTKEYYEERILEMKEYLSVELPNKDCNEKTRNRLKEEYEAGIESCTRKMREAPDAIDYNVDPIFTNEYFILLTEQKQTESEEREITSREVIERDNTELIDVIWNHNSESMKLAVQRSDSPICNSFNYSVKENANKASENMRANTVRKNEDDLSSLNMSYKEALSVAEDAIINKLGVDYFSMAHAATDEKSYIFFFTRNINGINDTYCSNTLNYAEIYDKPWPYENMYVKVDDRGIREISSHSSFTKLGELVSEDAIILTFEQIKEIAKTQFEIGNINFAGTPLTSDLYENLSSMEMIMDEIVFGYQRVKLADNSGKYIMIPVWDFFGSYTMESKYSNGKKCERNSDDFDYVGMYRHSYLTINAIDGSIIDRSLGY